MRLQILLHLDSQNPRLFTWFSIKQGRKQVSHICRLSFSKNFYFFAAFCRFYTTGQFYTIGRFYTTGVLHLAGRIIPTQRKLTLFCFFHPLYSSSQVKRLHCVVWSETLVLQCQDILSPCLWRTFHGAKSCTSTSYSPYQMQSCSWCRSG